MKQLTDSGGGIRALLRYVNCIWRCDRFVGLNRFLIQFEQIKDLMSKYYRQIDIKVSKENEKDKMIDEAVDYEMKE